MAELPVADHILLSEPAERHSRLQVALVLFALATGGFAIGTGEFAIMGLLPDVANTFVMSTPVAGYVISAYALGAVLAFLGLLVFGVSVWLEQRSPAARLTQPLPSPAE
jgi:MFS transporter, DHA1 family, inner membrane transport protein